MRNSTVKTIALALLMYVPVQSMAWGMLGHRIVGEIADCYITKKTRKEIRSIFGNESIAMASNWADFIKSDPNFKYLDNWHYADFDRGISFAQMQSVLTKDTSTNAYTKLTFLISELKRSRFRRIKKRCI